MAAPEAWDAQGARVSEFEWERRAREQYERAALASDVLGLREIHALEDEVTKLTMQLEEEREIVDRWRRHASHLRGELVEAQRNDPSTRAESRARGPRSAGRA